MARYAAQSAVLPWNIARNNSILAHGYTPVDKDIAEKLFAATLQLADIKKTDLTFFPTLNH